MIYLSILLHIYQPPTQYPAVTKKITNDSYRLILKILEKTKGKITLNIPASLTEQLAANKDEDVIKRIRSLVEKKQVELTGCAAYHPLLPKLAQNLIKRQIELNTMINQKYFGRLYCPDGFFPPEMGFSNKVGKVLEELKFKWVILDEFAYSRKLETMKHDVVYITTERKYSKNNSQNDLGNFGKLGKIDNKEIKFFFRDERLSNSIALSSIKSLGDFNSVMASYHFKKDNYLIIAIDGETFGHHQIGQDKLLSDLLSCNKYNIVLVSELGKYFQTKVSIEPLVSSWGMNRDDLRKKIYWPRWSYPGNKIHLLQWRLTKIAIAFWLKAEDGRWKIEDRPGPSIFDKALHSDQYWWASHRPYWHPEMVKRGAKLLLQSIVVNPKNSALQKKDAEVIYNDILDEVRKVGGRVVNK